MCKKRLRLGRFGTARMCCPAGAPPQPGQACMSAWERSGLAGWAADSLHSIMANGQLKCAGCAWYGRGLCCCPGEPPQAGEIHHRTSAGCGGWLCRRGPGGAGREQTDHEPAMGANGALGCMGGVSDRRTSPPLSPSEALGCCVLRDTDLVERIQPRAIEIMKGLEHLSQERLREPGVLSEDEKAQG